MPKATHNFTSIKPKKQKPTPLPDVPNTKIEKAPELGPKKIKDGTGFGVKKASKTGYEVYN